MNISRYLDTELIKLDMDYEMPPPDEADEGYSKREVLSIKEAIIAELVDLLDKSGNVSNKSKLNTDLFNREKKASTAIGKGIAVPHVRTMQARDFTIAVAREFSGYEFDAPDEKPVQLFFCMAAPPYDDDLYLKVFKSLAERFEYPGFIERLLEADDEHMIIRAFKEFE